jgi:hypothetical protein
MNDQLDLWKSTCTMATRRRQLALSTTMTATWVDDGLSEANADKRSNGVLKFKITIAKSTGLAESGFAVSASDAVSSDVEAIARFSMDFLARLSSRAAIVAREERSQSKMGSTVHFCCRRLPHGAFDRWWLDPSNLRKWRRRQHDLFGRNPMGRSG